MDAETTGIAVSSVAVGALCGVASTWIKARFGGRARIEPSPLPVDGKVEKKQQFITVGECNRRMCEHTADIQRLRDEIRSGNDAVLAKLDAMDDKSEARAIALNRRVDPMMERLAETKGRVDSIERRISDAVAAAATGGTK